MDITRDMLKHSHYVWEDETTGMLPAGAEWEHPFVPHSGSHTLAVLQRAADALRLANAADIHVIEELLRSEFAESGATSRHDAFLWLYVEYKKRAYRNRPS